MNVVVVFVVVAVLAVLALVAAVVVAMCCFCFIGFHGVDMHGAQGFPPTGSWEEIPRALASRLYIPAALAEYVSATSVICAVPQDVTVRSSHMAQHSSCKGSVYVKGTMVHNNVRSTWKYMRHKMQTEHDPKDGVLDL